MWPKKPKEISKIHVILFLLGIFILYTPPIDPDFGWHFKYGEFIVQNKAIPKQNLFSYTMPNYRWANSYWISEVILYLTYSTLGTLGAGLLLAGLVTFITIKILENYFKDQKNSTINRFSKNLILSISSLIIFVYYGYAAVPCRPLLASTIFLLVLTYTLLEKKENIKWLPFLFLTWANMHADFTLGLAILGIYNLQILIQGGIKKDNMKVHLISLLCVIITVINPYGVRLHETLLKETHPLQFKHIVEWLPLVKKDFMTFYFVTMGLFWAAILQIKNMKKHIWYLIVVTAFFIASIRSTYFIRIFVILAIFPFVDFCKEWLSEIKSLFRKNERMRIKKAYNYTSFAIFLIFGGSFAINVYEGRHPEIWQKKAGYPYDDVQYIKENPEKFKGRMFNEYSWGGYLIWQLPEHKTFIDGRMPSWRDDENNSVFEEYIKITKKLENREALLEKHEIKWILMEKDSKLPKLLEETNGDNWYLLKQSQSTYLLKKREQ
ncbi:hypothetical protein GF360_00700 [candidate division WWE3 bacterium]|nr:hypothetical protein [candidate division WWE3 bacterium]